MEKKCHSIISIKSKCKFKNKRKINIFNLISKLLLFLLYILIIILVIFLIKNSSNNSNSNNKNKSSSEIKSKRKMSSDSNNESTKEINKGYIILVFIAIIGLIISIIFIVILFLIFYKNNTNPESYNILLVYAFCIDIIYIILTWFLFGRVPSSQILFLIIPYLALIPIFIFLIIRKAICICCKISMKEYFKIFFSLPFIIVYSIFKGSSFSCDCCCSCCYTDSSSPRTTNEVMVIIGYARTDENIGSSGHVTHTSSSDYSSGDICYLFCHICKCEYIFLFLYLILLGSAFIYNSVLYYIGLVCLSIIICIFFLFYIIPLLIAFLFAKCCCCEIIEEINNKENDKLSYSYYCNNNKTPLVFAFIIIILSILATAIIFILINISKIKEAFMLFLGLTL